MHAGVREPLPGVVYPPVERLQRYVDAGALPPETLTQALERALVAHRDRVALSSPEGLVTYAELDERTDRLAAAMLRLGLEPLDRVLFQAINSRELVYAVVACFKAGLIPVCTLAAHREHEISYLGRHAAARAHIVQGDDPKFDLPTFALQMRARIASMRHVISLQGRSRPGVLALEELIASEDPDDAKSRLKDIERDPFQVAVFQLSGGTTSVPKIIPRMQNDYLLNAQLTAQCLGYTPEDVMFIPMQIIHNAAMICFLIPALLSGAEFTLPADMTPEGWGRIFRARRPTWVGLIRALLPRFNAMIEQGHADLGRIRGFWAPDAARVIRRKYRIRAHAMFGMSEGLNMYVREGDPDEVQDNTVGRPLSPFDEVRLVVPGTDQEVEVGEVGELTCRGPYTLCGYYDAAERNSQAFTADGFYRTGDLMVQREVEDRLYYAFAGRTKDTISRGFEKINCEEVEGLIGTHPAISDCAVVGMPDPVLGERGCVFIVPAAGRTAPGVPELGAFLKELGVARFKWPERVESVAELPLTKAGKLDKARLRERITALIEQEASTT